jgi:hypothetical protein
MSAVHWVRPTIEPSPKRKRKINKFKISCVWNATVGIYDPYANKMVDILEFPGISHDPDYHIGGVAADRKTGLISILVDAWVAFETGGANVSGTYTIMQWDPKTRNINYKLNITALTKGKYGGFQDVEMDPDSNVYIVGTYPGSILKVDKYGKSIEAWYPPPPPINTTQSGLAGLAAKDWILLANDKNSGQLWRFDMRDRKGVPTPIPLTPNTVIGEGGITDAIYLPPKYGGTVLLVAEDLLGIKVFRSRDGKWEKAEYLGYVPGTDIPNLVVTAPIQVGDGLYMVELSFGNDNQVPGTDAGPQSEFPFPDITAQVEALLKK